ncbi:hypothetical protein MKW94_015165 [Papaver nudicaule]|uniref:Transmembrane protein n=1 Tax=Papaver nudicaule TaxID=74823 RepID=A0AA41SH40_PAPNU|nr:hypothetical protein [Papaver nudicaule]
MISEDQRRGGGGGGAPHGILLMVVVGLVIILPMILGDGEAITEAISEMLSPIGLLLIPIILLLLIQFLSSSDRGVSFVSTIAVGEPDSIHRLSGSPVGVALFLALVLFLLYNRFSLFGSDDDE